MWDLFPEDDRIVEGLTLSPAEMIKEVTMTKVRPFLVFYFNGDDVGVVVVNDDMNVFSFRELTNKNGTIPKYSCADVGGFVLLVEISN